MEEEITCFFNKLMKFFHNDTNAEKFRNDFIDSTIKTIQEHRKYHHRFNIGKYCDDENFCCDLNVINLISKNFCFDRRLIKKPDKVNCKLEKFIRNYFT